MNEKTINFSNKLNKKYNNEYIVLEEYKRANIKIKVKHLNCKRNNITLFRIKYIYQKNINEILNKAILEEDSETIHKFAIHIAD